MLTLSVDVIFYIDIAAIIGLVAYGWIAIRFFR